MIDLRLGDYTKMKCPAELAVGLSQSHRFTLWGKGWAGESDSHFHAVPRWRGDICRMSYPTSNYFLLMQALQVTNRHSRFLFSGTGELLRQAV